MTAPVTRKRDFEKLESRRIEAGKLLNRGLSQAEVARQVQVSRQSVRRWWNQFAKHGTRGLKKAGFAGRPPKLAATDLQKLESILLQGPEKSGFPGGLWTLERIGKILSKELGVSYHTSHVWWLLRKKLGWSCQRPIGRARERNEAAIKEWQKTTWPALKKRPKKKAEPLSS
jgi:transposase